MAFVKNSGKNANLLSQRDPGQVLQDSHNMREYALDTLTVNSLVPHRYSKITWDYQTLLDGSKEVKYLYFWGFGEKESNQFEIYEKPLGSKETTTINFTNQTAAGLAGKYFFIFDDGGSVAAWYNFNSSNTQPVVVANRFLEVTVVSGDTPADLALKTRNVFNADSEYTAVNSGTYVMIESITNGNKNNAVNGDTNLYISVQNGTETINSKYILITDDSNNTYYVWFNSNGTGIDPAVPLTTGIEVVLGIAETANTVAQKITLALTPTPRIKVSQDGVFVVIGNLYDGVSNGVVDFNTGFYINNIKTGADKPIVGQVEIILDDDGCPVAFEVII